MKPHPLDHCVLPTQSLAVARARLSALGFTVAADTQHPFGTANCCVYLEDGTYMEPLAVADDQLVENACREGNTFVERDRRYRNTRGDEGFSALVIGTTEAVADHDRFVAEGDSAGPLLSFSRPFIDTDGTIGEAAFKLAFAAPAHEDVFFFTCERVKTPSTDRTSLQRHANGVFGISQILVTAPRPPDYEDFFSRYCGARPSHGTDGETDFELANAKVCLIPSNLVQERGIEPGDGSGLSLIGIAFRTAHLAAIRERLAVAGIRYSVCEHRIVLPPAPGQGGTFIFEECEP